MDTHSATPYFTATLSNLEELEKFLNRDVPTGDKTETETMETPETPTENKKYVTTRKQQPPKKYIGSDNQPKKYSQTNPLKENSKNTHHYRDKIP